MEGPKKKICIKFNKSVCPFGDKCNFEHRRVHGICQNFLKGTCPRRDEECLYQHKQPEPKPVEDEESNVKRRYKVSKCKNGDDCRLHKKNNCFYYHSSEDQRKAGDNMSEEVLAQALKVKRFLEKPKPKPEPKPKTNPEPNNDAKQLELNIQMRYKTKRCNYPKC
jgi:hypothetical protein